MALGTVPASAVRNTAVPSTRTGGLTNTASKKLGRSMASAISFWFIRRRPSFQVAMMVYRPTAMAKGNQPPWAILSELEAKNAASMTKNTLVEAMHNHNGYFQP